METNKNNQNQTKFEELLKIMCLEDKKQVFNALNRVNELFKDYAELMGYKWLETMAGDEPLRNIFICNGIAAQMWFNEDRKRELEKQENND